MLFRSSYFNQGFIPGANINQILAYSKKDNIDEEENEDEGYEGALVSWPQLNQYFGEKLYGKRTNNIFRYSIDMDMKAFYPNTNEANNISEETLIFKAIIDAAQFKNRGGDIPYHGITDVQLQPQPDSFVDDIAKEVFDDFQSKNYLSIGTKFLGLPSVGELDMLIKERLGGRE